MIGFGQKTYVPDDNFDKKILQKFDILGREIKVKTNKLLFYIYDDGTVEKRIIID